ncbi:MAG: hypothetical protein NT051_06475 [Candidatus Micrarchaeota archaeon]|nr:hypothetical protein [Candidatus Micrarchaeota archaeon]
MSFNIYDDSNIAFAWDRPMNDKGTGTASSGQKTGPLSRLSKDELALPFEERYFRDMVRCGQFRIISENPLAHPENREGQKETDWSRRRRNANLIAQIKELADGNEWEKLGLLKGSIEYKVGKDYSGDIENRRYWWGELQKEISGRGEKWVNFSLLTEFKMLWIFNYYGTLDKAAKELSGSSQGAVTFGQFHSMNRREFMRTCDDLHESLRRKSGFSGIEKLTLIKLEQRIPFSKRDIDIMRQIYRSPTTWKTDDFANGYNVLLRTLDKSPYKVAQFQCSKWFDILTSMPDAVLLSREIERYCAENGKKIRLCLTQEQERRLQKENEMIEAGDYKVRNRGGKWELHKTILPWEMKVAPQGWFKNKLMFRFSPSKTISGEAAEWLEGLQPEERKRLLEAKNGENFYFQYHGKRVHAARKYHGIEVYEDNRHMLIKFVNWAQEQGIMPYNLLGNTLRKLAFTLESEISSSFVFVKMAVPEIIPQDMPRLQRLTDGEMREKALRIYPDWDDWFCHQYPQYAGRDDGIVKFGKDCVPIQAQQEKPTLDSLKSKALDGSLPLPCFEGKDAELPIRQKAEKFSIENFGTYRVYLPEATCVEEVARLVGKIREDKERKGFVFTSNAKNEAIRAAVMEMIEGGKCLELVEAGAISHIIPSWYTDNIEHGRFWMKMIANEKCNGDIHQIANLQFHEAGLGMYLNKHSKSLGKILRHYFPDELDPSRLKGCPAWLVPRKDEKALVQHPNRKIEK